MPEDKVYDIIVIGAGIQGAGVAQATAACGYKTLVLEKYSDAGLGTSSKSSKLIHGGLRYLESRQFKLVLECLNERKRLLKNAPKLVNLVPFYIPVYSHNIRPAWLIWTGLFIYSLFSIKPFSIIKKNTWKSLDNIKTDKIKTIFKYYDAQTDDQKLTKSVISSAEKHGAKVQYNADFIESHILDNTHKVIYKKNSKKHTVECRCIINCTGPWVKSTQERITPLLELPPIELVAGTHIIVNRPIKQGIYYVEAEDNRAVFVMPWKNKQTLIGTTERSYTGGADCITPTENEITYLIRTYNRYFKMHLSRDDISDSFTGLRVLPAHGKLAFNKPRESLITHNSTTPGLVTLIGGKLTSYRSSSEAALLKINKILGELNKDRPCRTKNIKL